MRKPASFATFVVSLAFAACGQNAPQQIPMTPTPGVPGVPPVAVPGQVPAVPGFVPPVAPTIPVAPVAPIAIAPVTPTVPITPTAPPVGLAPAGTSLVPGQVASAPQTVPPPPPGADPRSAERMREYTLEMFGRGFSPHGPPGADTLGPRESDNFAITMNGGDCYRIAGFGGAGVRDLDAYLYDPTGRQMVRDFATDSRPIVSACATSTGPYRVRFHMYTGAGPYTYQVYRAAGGAVQAEGLAGLDPVVRRRLETFTASRLAKGYRAISGIAGSGVLSTNQTQNFAANLESGRCYQVAGFGGQGVADLDIFLYGPGGNEVARDEARDATPLVQHCPSQGGAFTVKVKMFQGNGPFALQAYQTGS
jgi:hypothetical protein